MARRLFSCGQKWAQTKFVLELKSPVLSMVVVDIHYYFASVLVRGFTILNHKWPNCLLLLFLELVKVSESV